jgi:hypothetical protein
MMTDVVSQRKLSGREEKLASYAHLSDESGQNLCWWHAQ